MSIFEPFQWFSHVFQEEWSKFKLWAWKCRFKYKPMQKGENLLPMSQETSIQYFLFVRPLTCLDSCVAQGVCSSGRMEKGLRRGTVPLSWPLSSPPRSPKKSQFSCWCFSRDAHLVPSGITRGPPTWGALYFALIVMPQPVTVMGKGQAPRQTGGEISQHPLPALGILSHLENAKKKKERKMNKMITYNRTAQSAECSVNISELIPLMHIKLWYYW